MWQHLNIQIQALKDEDFDPPLIQKVWYHILIFLCIPEPQL